MQGGVATAGRKRAAVELIARRGAELRQVARRYSLCEEDAEDAYQRALEILLVKAPSERPRELIRWTRTVIKHEALAVRANRERLLGAGESEAEAWLVRLPAAASEPEERLVRRERVAGAREALQALKPAELRSLTLLAAGYTYAEIGEITGYSSRKVERCLVEGRERFRRLLTAGEEGARCAELRPLLSAYCDREASAAQSVAVREHLRACGACRATMRAYRAAPATVAALAPSLPLSRSLLERAQELLLGVKARLPGGGGMTGESATQAATAGGAGGAGIAAVAKGLAVCAGTVGAATACVAAGVAPAPLAVGPERDAPARVERVAERVIEEAAPPPVEREPEPEPAPPAAEPEPRPEPEPAAAFEPEPAPEASDGAVEYAPPPEPPPPPSEPEAASAGSAAGEFGP